MNAQGRIRNEKVLTEDVHWINRHRKYEMNDVKVTCDTNVNVT